MQRTIPLSALTILLASWCLPATMNAQGCTNTSAYGTATPNADGTLTQISSCSYMSEYSTVNGVVAGANYEFTITGGGYITVREGTPTGPAIAQGYSPLVATATANGSLYPHWTVNDLCATASGCQTTTVQFLLNCVPPSATVTLVDDCANNQYSLDVNVTSVGDGASVDLVYSVNGGPDQTDPGLSTGVHTIGPFTVGQSVDLTVAHATDPMCNRYFTGLGTASNCPIILECGGAPLDQAYCYTNNDNHHWLYQSDNNEQLIMIFSAGSVESSTWDHLRIYNGPNNQSPLLYENPSGTTNIAGVQVIASSGQIYMEITSDGSGSCATNSTWGWIWQVGCLDCTSPQATYNVVTDCANMQYSIEVNITELGSDPLLDITNNNGAPTVQADAPGTYTAGPFPAGTPTVITLSNDVNPLCNVSSTAMVNPLCPTIIQCGGNVLNEAYCYQNNDNHAWHWQASSNNPLVIQFSAGTIESATWDHLRVFDGPSNNSPLLFEHIQTSQLNLAGLELIASGTDIYMELTSDGSGSCQSSTQTEWAWEVGCMDCTNPAATYSMVEDCIHHSYSIAVNVTDLGSGAFVRIANSLGTDTLANIPTGLTMVGPFPMDSTVMLTVLSETNNLCRIYSQEFSSNSQACVDTVCAATAYEYCYANNDTAWFAYQGIAGVPLTVEFLWGTMLVNDFVQIYNGLAPLPANLRWQGNLDGDMTGWAVNTTNGFHTMLVRIVSNATGSCATGETQLPLHWVVQCGAVGIDENGSAEFAVYPNPSDGQFTLQLPAGVHGTVDLRVTDLSGRTVHHEVFGANGSPNTFDLHGLQTGNYVVSITTNDWVKAQQLQIIR